MQKHMIRFSGSDIAVLVRDALMEPVRKVQMSTHFKKVMAPSRKDPSKSTPHYTPCSPSDPQGEEKSWTSIGSDELLEPELSYTDFLRAASTVRPSVNASDLEKYVKWTVNFFDLFVCIILQGHTCLICFFEWSIS